MQPFTMVVFGGNTLLVELKSLLMLLKRII